MNDRNQYYNTFDTPISYKNLELYPVIMRKYFDLMFYVQCLLLDKNSEPDSNIIGMSYLEYLIYLELIVKDGKNWLAMFGELLKLCTKRDDLVLTVKKEGNRAVLLINDVAYTGDEFNELKTIICEQNIIEIPDENIQKEVRDNLRKAQEYKLKVSGFKPPSLEDEMVCLMVSTSLKLDEIYDLPIRKFRKILERADAKLHYEIYLSASMSGFVEFKDKKALRHWTSDLTRDKYSDVLIDEDDLKKKVDLTDAKNK